MKDIVVFRKKEVCILNQIMEILNVKGKENEISIINSNENALHDLAKSISHYPSILGEQYLGGISRSVETLVENLCIKDILDLKLHTPTKAILGQGFAVAKINFFFMLLYLCKEIKELNSIADLILEIISNNVFALMAEEVFLSIISDWNTSHHIRANAAYLLANLWERRIDCGVREFVPILENIWMARNKLKPSFGTMIGISELLILSERSDPVWIDFLERDDLKQDEIDALREFLMGISFEEMEELTSEMEKTGKTSLCKNEINDILGEKKIYPEYTADDPRELYKSFRHRKNNASFRARAGLRGPKKTIEECIMCYLLARPQ